MKLSVGDKIPDFSLPVVGGKELSPSDFKGKKLVIYFYPMDHTPFCTNEAKGFRDFSDSFAEKNTLILGVSKDSLERHQGFANKHDLNFPLGSDKDGHVCEDFGVCFSLNLFGYNLFNLVERSTFLVDEEGIIQHIWHDVKVAGHVEEVLEEVTKH